MSQRDPSAPLGYPFGALAGNGARPRAPLPAMFSGRRQSRSLLAFAAGRCAATPREASAPGAVNSSRLRAGTAPCPAPRRSRVPGTAGTGDTQLEKEVQLVRAGHCGAPPFAGRQVSVPRDATQGPGSRRRMGGERCLCTRRKAKAAWKQQLRLSAASPNILLLLPSSSSFWA